MDHLILAVLLYISIIGFFYYPNESVTQPAGNFPEDCRQSSAIQYFLFDDDEPKVVDLPPAGSRQIGEAESRNMVKALRR